MPHRWSLASHKVANTLNISRKAAPSRININPSHSHPRLPDRNFHTTMSPSANGPASHKVLTIESINPAVLSVSYAVRGELALRADEYSQQISAAANVAHNLPFEKVVTANIGNPQQKGLDQEPITYWRQVISLLEYPPLMNEHIEIAKKIYPADAISKAKQLHSEIGSVGAYTHSKGILAVRQRVAKFIQGAFCQATLSTRGLISRP
jgi:hypothetical protein